MVAAGSGKPGTPPAQYTEAREGSATVQTGLIDRGITELNKLIEEAGFDPESWMLKPGTGIRKSDWDSMRRVDGETIVQPMQSVRMELVQRTMPVNVDELVREIGKQVPAPAISTSTTGTFVCMWSDSQVGKALAIDTPVLTTAGWKRHGDLQVGDYVYGQDGLPHIVEKVWDRITGPLYRVTLGDGTSVVASGDHLWQGERKMHPRGYGDGKRPGVDDWETRTMTRTTEEILDMTKQRAYKARPLRVPEIQPIEMPERELPIAPHLLGLWLGDGNSHNGHITKSQQDRALLEQYGHEVPSNSLGNRFGVNIPGLKVKLIENGLLKNKHIPKDYLYGSIQQRLELVQGLMDTDGTVSHGQASFCNTNLDIVKKLRFILESLGVRTRWAERPGKLYGVEKKMAYYLYFRTDLPVFTLRRKAERMRASQERKGIYRSIVSVEMIGVGEANCITVEGSLYLAGKNLILTHNCESPLDQLIPNFKGMVLQSVNEFKRSGLPDVHIPMLGDACEGIVSQGGKNMWRTTLTVTEQVRVLRRLYLWIIDQFVDAGAHRITAVTVASNHGQAQRQPVETRADDDWGIDALVAVDDAIKLNPDRYGHVEIYVPGDDEANVVLEIAGVVIAHTHGHHFYKGGNAKKSAFDWWRGNTFSGTDIGQATLLLSGHGHHMEIAEESGKTWIMAPAVESESNWWRLRTGQTGDPGMITFEIVDGVVQRLTRLRPKEIGTTND